MAKPVIKKKAAKAVPKVIVPQVATDTLASTRVESLKLATSWLENRVFDLYNTPYNIANAEELASLILKWAYTGQGVMAQIQAASVEKPDATTTAEAPQKMKYA